VPQALRIAVGRNRNRQSPIQSPITNRQSPIQSAICNRQSAVNYQVLARKWRPQRFDDVIGQRGVTQTLRNAIAA
jgi:hypothetical protein